MSKMTLFGSFAMGLRVNLKASNGREYLGYIQGIRLESGYSTGASPHQFLVDLMLGDRSGTVTDIYVRTED